MSKCTFTGHKTLENKHKPLVLKELRKLWNVEEQDLPWEVGDYSPSNTLLVDDSPYKALRNPVFVQPLMPSFSKFTYTEYETPTAFLYLVQPHTAIFPHSYSYLNWNDDSLGMCSCLWCFTYTLLQLIHALCFKFLISRSQWRPSCVSAEPSRCR